MSNNSNNNNSNKNQKGYVLPSPEALKSAVDMPPLMTMNYSGQVWTTTLNDVSDEVCDIIATTCGLPELADIYFDVAYDRQARMFTRDTRCYAIFNPNNRNQNEPANVWLLGTNGQTTNNGVRLGVEINNYAGSNGRFGASDKFKTVMARFAADSVTEYLDGDKVNITISELARHKGIPVVELDLMKVLQTALNVNDDYINFALMSAVPINNGSNYYLQLCKYIDTSSANRRRNRRGLNLQDIRDELSRNQVNRRQHNGNDGRDNNRNNNNRRNF